MNWMYGDTFLGSLWPIVLGLGIIATAIWYPFHRMSERKKEREFQEWKTKYDAREAERKAAKKAAKRKR